MRLCAFAARAGKTRLNVLPLPCSDAISTRPPFGDAADERQTDTEPAEPARCRTVDLVEGVEHGVSLDRIDPDSLIGHRDRERRLPLVRERLHGYRDDPAVR